MPVRFDCPHCKAHYDVADDLAGKMIMCRVCKKRAPVQSLNVKPLSTTTATASKPSSAQSSRRVFLIGISLASLGAIGVGALLARAPWQRRGFPPRSSAPDGSPDRQRWRGPPADAKNDDKGSGV